MKSILRATGAAGLTAALAVALAATPAVAATHPSLASVTRSVHAADGALLKLERLAAKNPTAAKQALVRTRSQIAAAAHQARALRGHADAATAAAAFSQVAAQYDRDLSAFTSLLAGTQGSLQSLIAQALQPVLTGKTQALGFLDQLTTVLPAGLASTATTTVASLLANAPAEIQSLSGLFTTVQLSQPIQSLIAQAITTAGGVLDAGLAELKSLVPSLPAAAQSVVSDLLAQLTTMFGQLQSSLTQITQTITGALSGQLTQVTNLLQTLLAGTGGKAGPGAATGGLQLPPFISNLLGSLGLGSLFPTSSAGH